MHYPNKPERHEPYESRGSRADLWGPEAETPPATRQQMKHSVLLGREGRAEEIGYTALFLASDESSYITGTDIVVDGGWFSAAPYLTNERSHHMLELLKAKDKAGDLIEEFRSHFR